MNDRALTISVVICCYADERFDDLVAAVDSVRRQSSPPVEVAVVVDHNAGLLERARAALPEILIVPNGEPQGLSGARNTGIAATRGEIVAFLDDDVIAEPDWLERIAAPYADENVAGVGGSILASWRQRRPPWFPEEFDWVVGCTYRGLPTQPAGLRNLIGANMSFRRTVLEAAGGFAVEMGRTGSYPLGNDDTEFCIRARQTFPRRVLLYEPRARVWHTVPAARASWRYFRTRCFAEGLAKAALTRVSGSGEGLSSERAYVARVLPRGVADGLADVVAGDPAGAGRSLAIVSGLLTTAAGYATGRTLAALGAASALRRVATPRFGFARESAAQEPQAGRPAP